jgi:5'-deoxynucleotidase YfbR-like HD superfamily hydrolase
MKQPKRYREDVKFIFEMGNMRLIKRMGSRFLGAFEADLADHHFRVFWIAMIIAAHEGRVDTGKIAKLALVHDIAESRAGDVDYLARQYVTRNEELAIKDMLDGTALAQEFYELWQEYEKRQSLEAKIVKDADNLDVDFELAESAAAGHSLPDVWDAHRTERAKRLYTATARKLFTELKNSSPHDWHLEGRNRLNAGDWKK